MVEPNLKKDAIIKIFGKDDNSILMSLSYLNEQEIPLLSIMQALSDIDPFFKRIFQPLLKAHLQMKKSVHGFGVITYKDILNPYKEYGLPPKPEASISIEQTQEETPKKKRKWRLI